jgi:site-specific recombinase XerD
MAVEEYLSEKEATGALSQSSIRNRGFELNCFSNFCKSHSVENIEDIHKNLIISYLKDKKILKSSKLGIIYILTSFMDYLVNEGLILENIASVIDKPKTYAPKTDYLTLSELERIYQNEAQNPTKKVIDRNLLLFSLFTDICLRVSEVVNLKLEDAQLENKELWITRKRGKVEKIPLNDDLVNKFLNWYTVREQYKGSEQAWVFLSTHGQQLTARQVHSIVSQALSRANIIKRKHGPHLLRHSGASLKAKAGENLIMVQYLLGHENLNTTRRYLHFDWEDLQKMVERSQSPKDSEARTAD